MNIGLSKKAEKEFHQLPKSEAKKVGRKLKLLGESPFMGKKLHGELASQYSLRAWPYRIVYEISDSKEQVTVVTIEHRQGVYK